jgi:hypothetical protein
MNIADQYYPAKRLHDKMVGYLDEYTEYLLLVKSDGTCVSHRDVIHQYINYLLNYHLPSDFSQITVAMTNSGFYAKYKANNEALISKDEVKGILKGFFIFLKGKHDIRNEKVLKGLETK